MHANPGFNPKILGLVLAMYNGAEAEPEELEGLSPDLQEGNP